jgi:putative SOS response-associated peptidase YedK
MCRRPTFQPAEEFYDRFHIVNRLDTHMARYNIAPGQMVSVIIAQNPRPVALMRWGLIPHWAKKEKTAYKIINAQVETLTQKPDFRSLLAVNCCLIPASGFYEWKGENRGKTPTTSIPGGGVLYVRRAV